jgi:hypothetical protein
MQTREIARNMEIAMNMLTQIETQDIKLEERIAAAIQAIKEARQHLYLSTSP